ncbi:recombination regulator RecX [Lederbergia wuyishanensis]|uniref:Regulatory protein RecX n=1 Tax=Lederbergia wuyishanensis TaxID=1347903 RepID=A0ABU0D7Y2_9BACI|nr:recombination regulator RecX [Lederbergia wuyishanensis]MCJ8009148.1 recombination regulator RecX [Lederbergia wuyishanensis]MDQ0344488.1 regulatory protein [Lederbergia wuyishanensis]
MPIITKITTQKNSTDRYNIYLDEAFAFGVDEEILIRYNLTKGKELTEFDITQIQYEDEIRKALNAAIVFLSYRMRSEDEIRQHLKKKEWEEPVIQAVLLELVNRKYINDLEFALAYVRTQVNGGKKGPITIKKELKQKGIKDQLIEQAIDEYSESQQIEHAVQLGNKVAKQNSKLSEIFLKQKIEQFLLTKGFPFGIIWVALEEIEYEKDEDDEYGALQIQAEKAHRKYNNLTGFEYEQKMKQTLFRKGFPIELIDRYLHENKE